MFEAILEVHKQSADSRAEFQEDSGRGSIESGDGD